MNDQQQQQQDDYSSVDLPSYDTYIEEINYLLGGDPPSRYNSMIVFEYSHWIIPGLFLVSGAPNNDNYMDMVKCGFKHFISLMEPFQEKEKDITYGERHRFSSDFTEKDKDTIISRFRIVDRKVATDEKALKIVNLIIENVTKKIPTVVHCFGGKGRAGTIAALVIGLLYNMKSKDCLKITNSLFRHRKNKGNKCKKMPQTKVQFDQVNRIVK